MPLQKTAKSLQILQPYMILSIPFSSEYLASNPNAFILAVSAFCSTLFPLSVLEIFSGRLKGPRRYDKNLSYLTKLRI
jgi:hypothetical protein